jgi:hypothetical protein
MTNSEIILYQNPDGNTKVGGQRPQLLNNRTDEQPNHEYRSITRKGRNFGKNEEEI